MGILSFLLLARETAISFRDALVLWPSSTAHTGENCLAVMNVLQILRGLRELPYMTSATCLVFLTPPPCQQILGTMGPGYMVNVTLGLAKIDHISEMTLYPKILKNASEPKLVGTKSSNLGRR